MIITKIPFKDVERAGISLRNQIDTYSVQKHALENDWDVAINGGMFSRGEKGVDPNYYWNIADLIIAGQLNNGGNYSDKGIAIGNSFSGIGAYWSTTANSKGKPVDFIGGAPTLLVDGKIYMDMKGLTVGFATTPMKRTALGISKDAFFVLTTNDDVATLDQVAKALLAAGAWWAINFDGGDSTARYDKKGGSYTRNRNVPTAFGVKLKGWPVVILDAGHNAKNPSNQSPDGTYKEWEHNLDVVNKMLPHLERCQVKGEIIEVLSADQNYELNTLVKLADASDGDVLVSVHSDASSTVSANGQTIFAYRLEGESMKLAQMIHKATVPFLGATDRGIKDGRNLRIIAGPKMPCVLIETRFHTNPADLVLLKSQVHREKEAQAIAQGIVWYFGKVWIPPFQTKNYIVKVGPPMDIVKAETLKNNLEQDGFSVSIE